jgi:hypothetical protein
MPSVTAIVDEALGLLREAHVPLAAGMTEAELLGVQRRYGIEFSPDHAELLRRATPRGERWLNWLDDNEEAVRGRLEWPTDSTLFDVENAAFWHPSWAERPSSHEAAVATARDEMAKMPRLIPLYSHRYMPAAPAPAGSPVFSVHQTDVIYYGRNLADYFAHEFGSRRLPLASKPIRIDFWSDLAEGEDFTLFW